MYFALIHTHPYTYAPRVSFRKVSGVLCVSSHHHDFPGCVVHRGYARESTCNADYCDAVRSTRRCTLQCLRRVAVPCDAIQYSPPSLLEQGIYNILETSAMHTWDEVDFVRRWLLKLGKKYIWIWFNKQNIRKYRCHSLKLPVNQFYKAAPLCSKM